MFRRVCLAIGIGCSLGVMNITGAVLYVDANSASPTAPYASWATAAVAIQDAIDAANDGDQILVTNGIYQTGGRVIYGVLTNRVAINKAVTVQSVNGPAVTVIQGNPVLSDSAVRCVYLTNNATLIGFTLTQGGTRNVQGDPQQEWMGGGAWCEGTNSIISNCVLTANSAANGGGGVENGTLTGCILSNNVSVVNYMDGSGGGAANSSTLNYCQIVNNSSAEGGGGAESCVLSFCVVAGNSGSGAYESTLNNCVVTNNAGSGVESCTANNCTIVGNIATYGGGAYASTLNNCIVYYNQDTANAGTSNYFACDFDACCTAPGVGGSSFTNAPNFVNFATGDLHLQSPSFCINAGDNAAVTTTTDMDGNPRIVETYVDVGAYEFQSAAPTPLAIESLQAVYTNFATGFPVNVSGSIAGHQTLSVIDFGDGTMVSNELSATHSWASGGNYTVTLTAYNADNPGGVSAGIILHVAANPISYVAQGNSNPVFPYNSWATAATNIQDAVNAAYVGGTVLVSNGVYQTGSVNRAGTNRVAVITPLTLQSVNGPAVTIIEGYQVPGTTNGPASIRCVYMASGTTLAGFTLTNGSTSTFGYGGGVFCADMSVTVSNCVLAGNSTQSTGGGGYFGTYSRCVISGNFALNGGGVGSGNLNNCLVVSNVASTNGGGIFQAAATNCTIVGNYAAAFGGGAYDGSLANCIVYYNRLGANNSAATNSFGSSAAYCCSTPFIFGAGNITNAPGFINLANGNFRLQTGSRCMNTGNNSLVVGGADLDGNPRIVGGTVDLGAYENQNSGPVHYVSLTNTSPVSPYTSWTTAATNIQDAIGAANTGDTVVADSGTYNQGGVVVFGSETNRVALTNGLTLLGLNGSATTIIVGGTQLRGVYVGSNSVLSGFTVTNGQTRITGDLVHEQSGGGIWCEASGMVLNCLVVSNLAGNGGSFPTNRLGGGIYGGSISNCVLAGNGSGSGGGAAAAQLWNCTLSNNFANQGGGAYQSAVYNSLVSSNAAMYNGMSGFGGGVFQCVTYTSTLTNNQASGSGGGAYQSTNFNCVFRNNSALVNGGGTASSTLFNCTLASNTAANEGGGDYQSMMRNCIVYYNTANEGSNYTGSVLVNCCTAPLQTQGSSGDITNAPLFVNLAGGDFHQLTNSPTINAGSNAFAMTATDFDGNPRIVGYTVDMGAYEYQGSNLGLPIPIPWLAEYGLPLNGSADYADTDGDGMNNWEEWIAGTNPTNPSSALRLTSAEPGVSGTTVTWVSVTNRNYFVQRSSSLGTPGDFQTVGTNVAGLAGTTSYLDTSATGAGPYFYRVGVQ